MVPSHKLQKSYDIIIVGLNFASLAFAAELEKQNRDFCILDSRHISAIPTKLIPGLDVSISTRVPFNSKKDDITPLNSAFPEAQIVELDGTPLTFEKAEFKSFLGFGDEKIAAMDAVLPFCQPGALNSSVSPEAFWDSAFGTLENKVFLDKQITDIINAEDAIESVELNGTTRVRGQHFYFFSQLGFLFEKMGSRAKKLTSQFAKTSWYSSVNLIIKHHQQPESSVFDQIYLLKGSKGQACLGQFTKIQDICFSRWESFFPVELTADSETTGTCLREIKKQMKRAFPDSQSSQDSEHIILHEGIFSDLSRLKPGLEKLSAYNNLSIVSHLVDPEVGWLYEVSSGYRAAQSFLTKEESDSPAPTSSNLSL